MSVANIYNDEVILRSVTFSQGGGHKISMSVDPEGWEALKNTPKNLRCAMVLVPIQEDGQPAEESDPRPVSNAQRAGILCNDLGFQQWAISCGAKGDGAVNAAANFVREKCHVKSRSELNSGEPAELWTRLMSSFVRRVAA